MTTAYAPRRKKGAEELLLDAIVQLAHLFGWEAHHEHDSRRSSAGWPDLELVRGERHIRAECKAEDRDDDDDLRPDQQRILGKLRQVPGLEVYVWRPRDWPHAIREILKPGRKPA